MTTYKKTIVLHNTTLPKFDGNAILTLQKQADGVYGTFKAFNITPNPNLLLGLSQNGKQVLKQNINLINNNIYNFKLNNISLDENLSCVLVIDEPTEVIPLIWGSDVKNTLTQEIVDNLNKLKQPKVVNTPNIDLSEMFEVDEKEVENIITNELDDTILLNEQNNYIEPNEDSIIVPDTNLNEKTEDTTIPAYDENLNPYNFKTESVSKILSEKSIIDQELENLNINVGDTFYDNIAEQIEDLFSKYPAETNLEELIPNSKWVKIDYENSGNYYVLGLIYEDISLKYICYGVPGEYKEVAPNGLDNYSQWLPTNVNEPTQDGYWVMYQNAITGESILVDAV